MQTWKNSANPRFNKPQRVVHLLRLGQSDPLFHLSTFCLCCYPEISCDKPIKLSFSSITAIRRLGKLFELSCCRHRTAFEVVSVSCPREGMLGWQRAATHLENFLLTFDLCRLCVVTQEQAYQRGAGEQNPSSPCFRAGDRP